ADRARRDLGLDDARLFRAARKHSFGQHDHSGERGTLGGGALCGPSDLGGGSMTLALDGWIWTSALGFGMLGMSVGRLVASAPPAPLPKVGRFQKERDRFRAEGAWAAGLLVVLQAFSAALWSVVPLKGLPVRYLNWQEHQLRLAGFPMGLSPREVPVLCLMTGLLSGAFVSALGSSTVASISVLLVGLALPIFRIQGLRGARVRAAAREVPRTMDLLSLCMSAGMDLVSGLKEVSKGDKGVVADELR